MNALAAAFRLSRVLIFSGGRKYLTGFVFLLPPALSIFIAHFDEAKGTLSNDDYAGIILLLYVLVFVPFTGIFWGSAVLTDEVDDRTLVYLWTRPVGRMQIFLMKFAAATTWFIVLLGLSLLVTYVGSFWRRGISGLISEGLMYVWDYRSLALGGVLYMSMAFFLSSLVKKPLIIGLIYVYTWDNIVMFLPGFLKRLSVRHYIYVLGTHPPEENQSPLVRLLNQNTTTETQAIVTLVVATVAFAVLAAWIISKKEFAGEDPARAQ